MEEHYQVRTFLIFTNSLDKDLVYLNSKNQESMHLGMENIIRNFLKPFFNEIAMFKNILSAKMSRYMPC